MKLFILADNSNERGDLFNRLVRDLFHSLGYDPVRQNVGKSGREVDLLGQHRLESGRYVVGECKATSDPTGGAEINKFIGVVDAEREQLRRVDSFKSLSPYFVSISGFKDSALEQEAAFTAKRVTLLTGDDVVRELIRGHIIVSETEAVDTASRCLSATSSLQLGPISLLVHSTGMYWAILYQQDLANSCYTLVHAGGTLVRREVAERIASTGGIPFDRSSLEYISPEGVIDLTSYAHQSRDRYFTYLEAACGDVQLDGLPADEQIGSKRLRLESLFVPLHVVDADSGEGVEAKSEPNGTKSRDEERTSRGHRHRQRKSVPSKRVAIGDVLATTTRVALLAAPGGGKSTLLKRIAVAYAFPNRRHKSADGLPERDWFPLFIRCRELGLNVRDPVRTILRNLGERAELDGDALNSFDILITDALATGNALLLVDGLDEIADDGDRIAFVSSLRTFSSTYATVSLIITSREAGFRAVAGAIAPDCLRLKIDDFDDADIRALIASWHTEVYGESAQGNAAAIQLADAVIENDRIRRLAGNPLLLTTLLLVKRWIGQLPTKRTVLYEKAIEVLLMTWNVQAHAPVNLDEALPRLEFIAYSMFHQGAQTISGPALRQTLMSARNDLPEALGFSRMSDVDFIDRIELRSSLLIQAGHTVENGRLVPLYEFRHLTFQEYLVARAVVEGHYPGRSDANQPADVLIPHLESEAWAEVIPMAAVLAGRDAKHILLPLVHRAEAVRKANDRDENSYAHLLLQCLLDEVQVAPHELDSILRVIALSRIIWVEEGWGANEILHSLLRGKFGSRFHEISRALYRDSGTDHHIISVIADYLGIVVIDGFGWSRADITSGSVDLDPLRAMFSSNDPVDLASAALAVLELAYFNSKIAPAVGETNEFGVPLKALLKRDEPYVQYAAAFALVWVVEAGWIPATSVVHTIIEDLGMIWYRHGLGEVTKMALWAMVSLPVGRFGALRNSVWVGELTELVGSELHPSSAQGVHAVSSETLILSYYLGTVFTRQELVLRIETTMEEQPPNTRSYLFEMLENLGPSGVRAARRLDSGE